MKATLIFVERFLGIGWKRIEDSCSNDARSLAVFRIVWGVFILLFYAPYSAWVAQIPQAFYKPPVLSAAFLCTGFPPYWVLLTMDLARIWLVVLITIGVKTRICTILLCLLTFGSSNFVYSLGKIDHDALTWAVALCLAFTNWGVAFALIPDRPVKPKVAARASATAGVLIAFGMFSAGFEKALHWINFDLSSSGFLSWFYPLYYTLGRTFLLAPVVLKVPPQFFKVCDFVAVALELSPFFFLLAGRVPWRFWLLTATVFHIANALLLNISFYLEVLVYLPFVALGHYIGKTRIGDGATMPLFPFRIPLIACPIILGMAHTVQRLGGGGAQFLFIAGSSDLSPLVLYVSLALLILGAGVIAADLITHLYGVRINRAQSRRDVLDFADRGSGRTEW
jgi:hypothetical protein